jgi:L-alanine-DL-glutamate epimerase-like enolase superfamily enzyme
MVDFHGRTTPDMAIQYAKVLEPYRPFFIEEPCLPENVPGMVKVAQMTDIPIATGERLAARFQFRELLEKSACVVVPWRNDVVNDPIIIRNRYVVPSERPRLGVEVNEREATKYPFQQEDLTRY